jgi:K(+)-stimulated pyrophosphate-energized sodium pump
LALASYNFALWGRNFSPFFCLLNTFDEWSFLKMRDLNSFEYGLIAVQFAVAILGLAYAWWLAQSILKEPKGSEKMQTVWNYIRTGANAYLRSQLRIIVTLVLVLMVALFFSVFVVKPTPYAIEKFCPEIAEEVRADPVLSALPETTLAERTEKIHQIEAAIVAEDARCTTARDQVAVGRALAFLMGAGFSAAVGTFGMRMAIQGNIRVAAAALDPKRGYGAAMQIAYRSGTITGMLTDGLGLFGGTIIFLYFGISSPDVLLGYGFGATLLALFMRVGGGIYTKAADVGADLVGKVEAGLPEDDPRNAAVIADLVGDNVGDCAGMAADIFESYEVAIVSALILGLAMATITGSPIFFIFPMFVRAIGVFCSVISTYFVKSTGGTDALAALTRGFYNAAALSVVLFGIFTFVYMKDVDAMGDIVIWQPFVLVIIGIVLAMVIDRVTALFTDTAHGAVKEIARNAQTGPATVVLSGLSNGMESSVWAILVIASAILSSVLVFSFFPITNAEGLSLVDNFTMIAYGVAMIGVGLLTLTGNNVSMDAFGPISDNAQGIAELAGEDSVEGNKILGQLDAVGNTTKAITKGIAIASAVIAAVALFSAFMTDTRVVEIGLGVASDMTLAARGINIADPQIFIGFLIGGAMIFMVSALLIRSVNRAAFQMIGVVRKQLKIPGVMEGTVTPDYAECVDVSTRAAQRELLPIGVIAIFTPIVVGLLFNAAALGGFLAGIILTGQLMAVFMSNAGGAWDNAKKYIEDGHYGGKRSEPHKAAVVGDTIGDPFKDTAGPALNPMIKVVNLVALLTAPIVVTLYVEGGDANNLMIARVVGIVLSVAIFAAIFLSKREDPEALKLAEAAAAADTKK